MIPLINCHNFFVDSLNASIDYKLMESIVVGRHGVSMDVKPGDWCKSDVAIWESDMIIHLPFVEQPYDVCGQLLHRSETY